MGFFSLNHKVSDVTAILNKIYKNHDSNSLKNLMEHTSERFASHIYSSYLKIQDCKFSKRKCISESEVINSTNMSKSLDKYNIIKI
jgi:hypothetical protein